MTVCLRSGADAAEKLCVILRAVKGTIVELVTRDWCASTGGDFIS